MATRIATFLGRKVVVEVVHVPAWGAGAAWEGVLRVGAHDGEDLLPYDGRKVWVDDATDEAKLADP